MHCLYEPPESRHTPCPPPSHWSLFALLFFPLPSSLSLSHPRQIAYDVSLMKRSTKPASPSSDSGRRGSPGGRRGGRGEVARWLTHAHIGTSQRGAMCYEWWRESRQSSREGGCSPFGTTTGEDFHRRSFRGLQGYRLALEPAQHRTIPVVLYE